MASAGGGGGSLESLGAELKDKAKKDEDRDADREVQGLQNYSSLRSVGAIVFNSGTLATNIAIVKTNVGLVYNLAVSAVVLNCLAILISTLQVTYGKPAKIRDLPSNEVGIVAYLLSAFLSFFKIGDHRSYKRDNSRTTDDRIDELDADLVGLRADLMSFVPAVSNADQANLREVCEYLSRVNFNQLSNSAIVRQTTSFYTGRDSGPLSTLTEEPSKDEPLALTMGASGAGSQPAREGGRRRKKMGVSDEDVRIRAQLMCPEFILGIQMAKRVLSQLGEDQPLETRRKSLRLMDNATKKGCFAGSESIFHGSCIRMFACCGILREDPYFDEDFWLKRKRVLLNVILLDNTRKDLAGRLTQSSSAWSYPLWVQQLNLVSTILGLAVLVLDIVVATYAGGNPSSNVDMRGT